MKKLLLTTLFGALLSSSNAQCTVSEVVNAGSGPCNFNFIGTQLGAASVIWFFGDGDMLVSSTGTHDYAFDGTYTACFVGYDTSGNVCDSSCTTITVIGCATPSCSPLFSEFGGTACDMNFSVSTGGSNTFAMNFGDGSTDSTQSTSLSHTFTTNGTYFVCVNGYDALGNLCGTSCHNVTVSGCIGIAEIEDISFFNLYPNPSSETITISSESISIFEYRIYDYSGKLVRNEITNSQVATINIQNLKAGYYSIVGYNNFGERLGSRSFIRNR